MTAVSTKDVNYITPPYALNQPLYVRETWQEVFETEYDDKAEGYCVNIRTLITNFDSIDKVNAGLSTMYSCESMKPRNKYYVFRAEELKYSNEKNKLKWRSPVTMPLEAARYTLTLKNITAMRVQDVTEDMALKMGCTGVRCDCLHKECGGGMVACTDCVNAGWLEPPTVEFWERLQEKYANRGMGWDLNPWAWVCDVLVGRR